MQSCTPPHVDVQCSVPQRARLRLGGFDAQLWSSGCAELARETCPLVAHRGGVTCPRHRRWDSSFCARLYSHRVPSRHTTEPMKLEDINENPHLRGESSVGIGRKQRLSLHCSASISQGKLTIRFDIPSLAKVREHLGPLK